MTHTIQDKVTMMKSKIAIQTNLDNCICNSSLNLFSYDISMFTFFGSVPLFQVRIKTNELCSHPMLRYLFLLARSHRQSIQTLSVAAARYPFKLDHRERFPTGRLETWRRCLPRRPWPGLQSGPPLLPAARRTPRRGRRRIDAAGSQTRHGRRWPGLARQRPRGVHAAPAAGRPKAGRWPAGRKPPLLPRQAARYSGWGGGVGG